MRRDGAGAGSAVPGAAGMDPILLGAPDTSGVGGPRMSVLHEAAPPAVAGRPRAASDTVRACTMTLVALVAWIITPPAAVLLFSTVGLIGVARAHRADKVIGHCSLGRPKLIVAYLAIAWLLGAWFTVAEVAAIMA